MNIRNLLIAAMGAAVLAGGAGAASANTPWQNHHPRRVEVNHRLVHLDRRIHQERREGDLNRFQARRLDRHVHEIRVQERRDARHHGGHITRREQVRLNHEETRVGRHVPA